MAQRKAHTLCSAGASVWVVSPAITKALEKLKNKKKISYSSSKYDRQYLKGAFLVIAATNDEKVNAAISSDASKRGVLVNVVDAPAASNFIIPSVIVKKDLIISISTSGEAPCLSKRMRKDFERLLVPEYAVFLSALKDIRKRLKARCENARARTKLLSGLVNINSP